MLTNLDLGAIGRLGNQMFQLSALIGMASRCGTVLRIPRENTESGFARFRDAATGVETDLHCELREVFALPEGWFVPRSDILPRIRYRYGEPHFHFDPEAMNVIAGTALQGYFQSPRYFEHTAEAVRRAFQFRPEIQRAAEELRRRMHGGLPIVAVHVRRGDYVALADRHPVLGAEHYRRALTIACGGERCQVWIFSDDPEGCRDAFPGCRVLEAGDRSVALCLMSLCDHFVIANSSFSWWGAWLGDHGRSRVVAPRQWFGPALSRHRTHDLLPPSWQLC